MDDHDRPLSRRDAERLLDAPAEHDSALGRALSAANGPARPEELRREDATVAAFHSARLSPSPAARTKVVSPARLGSRAAVQALVATAAVVGLASGGFALAGSVDLPGLPDRASDRASEAVSRAPGSDTTDAGTTDAGTSTSDETPTGSTTDSATGRPTKGSGSAESTVPPGSASATDDPTSSPTPNLIGLCTAFQASDRGEGTSLDSAAFTALAAAAGGADRIATYCVSLIGEPPSKPTPTSRPTDRPTPTTKPTDKPTDQPTGSPTVRPTPTTKPTDQPTPTDQSTNGSTNSPTDKPSPGKPTDNPAPPGKGGGKDSSTTGP